MSLLKKEKPAVPSTMTAIAKAKGKLNEITTAAEIADKESQEKILDLHKKKAALKVDRDKLADRILAMTTDFKKTFDEIRIAEAAAIEAESVSKKDLDNGHVSISEFLRLGKKAEQIAAEARAATGGKLAAARDSIRGLRFLQYDLDAKIADIQEKIEAEFNHVATVFWHRLDGLKKGLEEAGVSSSGIIQARYRTQEAQNDLSLAKGAVVFHAKQWIVKSIEDIRLLGLDPICQPAHFDALEKFAAELEHQVYPLTVNYWPSEGQGRAAGTFSFFPGPKYYEAKK